MAHRRNEFRVRGQGLGVQGLGFRGLGFRDCEFRV